jgi:hypothetical protein
MAASDFWQGGFDILQQMIQQLEDI